MLPGDEAQERNLNCMRVLAQSDSQKIYYYVLLTSQIRHKKQVSRKKLFVLNTIFGTLIMENSNLK